MDAPKFFVDQQNKCSTKYFGKVGGTCHGLVDDFILQKMNASNAASWSRKGPTTRIRGDHKPW